MPFLAMLKHLSNGEICVQKKSGHFDVETIITQEKRGNRHHSGVSICSFKLAIGYKKKH